MLYRCLLLLVLLLVQSAYASHTLEHALHADADGPECAFCLAAAPLGAAAVAAASGLLVQAATLAAVPLPVVPLPGVLPRYFHARAPPSRS